MNVLAGVALLPEASAIAIGRVLCLRRRLPLIAPEDPPARAADLARPMTLEPEAESADTRKELRYRARRPRSYVVALPSAEPVSLTINVAATARSLRKSSSPQVATCNGAYLQPQLSQSRRPWVADARRILLLIERLSVEGGFLDGLEMVVVPGLNVIVGPRGSGKTSIVELLRFAVGAGRTTPRGLDPDRHAISVLGDGRVTVVAVLDGKRVVYSRSASEDRASRESVPTAATFLAQTEVEEVATDSLGRRSLLDGFVSTSVVNRTETSLTARIASVTTELRQITAQIGDIDDQLAVLEDAVAALEAASKEQAAFLAESPDLKAQASEVERVTTEGLTLTRRVDALREARTVLTDFRTRLDLLGAAELPNWRGRGDPLTDVRPDVAATNARTIEARNSLDKALRRIAELEPVATEALGAHAERERQMRRALEDAQKGLGSVARRVSDARKRVELRESLLDARGARAERVNALQARRLSALDDLEKVRAVRYDARAGAAAEINAALSPTVRIAVSQAGDRTDYESAITVALRGSGLHYGALAPLIAECLSPRELSDAVEQRDSETISALSNISVDRAEKLIAHLLATGTQSLLTADIDDAVSFSLLDGGEYKDTGALSTGQRCTVVLSILLVKHGQLLVIDQPEDHLDNAYVASTLAAALRRREPGDQFIFTTHNANIPVLGEADRVTLLNSDGHRGFIRASGRLDDLPIVDAISTVMEGGRDAFKRRAELYGI